MLKKQIIRSFYKLKEIECKEEFMRRHGIEFEYDKHHNMTVYADDGILQLFPIIK